MSFDFILIPVFASVFTQPSIQCGTYYQRFGRDRPSSEQDLELNNFETIKLSVRDRDDVQGANPRTIVAKIKEVDNQRESIISSVGGGNLLELERVLVPQAAIFSGVIKGDEGSVVSLLQIPGKNHRVTFVSERYKINTNHPHFIHKRLRLSMNYLTMVGHRLMRTVKTEVNKTILALEDSLDDGEWGDHRYTMDPGSLSDVCMPVFRYPYSAGRRCCSTMVPLNTTSCRGRSVRCSYPPCMTGRSPCCPSSHMYDYYYLGELYCCNTHTLDRQQLVEEEESCQVGKV